MIRLDFLGNHGPGVLQADRIEQRPRHVTDKHISPVSDTISPGKPFGTESCREKLWHFYMVAEDCGSRKLAFLPQLKSQGFQRAFLSTTHYRLASYAIRA
jgi:hypothetical protein